jgi:hypothetical protein
MGIDKKIFKVTSVGGLSYEIFENAVLDGVC